MRFLSLLVLSAAIASAQVKITSDGDKIHVEINGKLFTDFVLKQGEAMKPYLYPLNTASGKAVTRHFPIENVEGEPKDHPHQRGLWFGHDDVNGNDFWNNETSYQVRPNRPKKAWIKVDKITETKDGAKSGTIGALLSWSDLDGNKLVDEKRTMIFRADGDMRIIDLDITLTAAIQAKFGDSKDGVLGVRLARELQESPGEKTDTMPHLGMMVNAEGEEREKGVWGKPSNWVDYSGPVEGEKVGIAILDHPKNSKRARWHSRGYGLFAANPFGWSAFTNDKSQDGSVTVEQGGTLHFQYRIIIHPGDAKSAGIAKMWDQYVK